ncbi:hypothetical protein LguiA_000405 [Lonicera macranthoides]
MEASSGPSPRANSISFNEGRGEDDSELQKFDLESSGHNTRSDHHFQSNSALEILRETVRILRYNLTAFMWILTLLICPVSAVFLSSVLVNQSIVKRFTRRLLSIVKSSGLPIKPFIQQSCHNFSEMAVSTAMCFPLYITLLLMSKAAVVYSVDCTYSRKMFDASKFYVVIRKIWRRIVSTYMWVCMVIIGCLTVFLVLFVALSSLFSVIGVSLDLIVCSAVIVGLAFSVFFVNAIIICNLAIVISVLEDVSGWKALLWSSVLIKGQTQVGILMFLGSTTGMAFVKGLYEHRVRTLSYGDGSSRIWEGPLLVLMYSFVALVDSMMNVVFYFSCKSYSLESSDEEFQPVLESSPISSISLDI